MSFPLGWQGDSQIGWQYFKRSEIGVSLQDNPDQILLIFTPDFTGGRNDDF